MTLSVISLAQVLGIFPDTTQVVIDGRLNLCKVIGVHCASAIQNEVEINQLETMASSTVLHNDDVLSIGIRDFEGQILTQAGDHESLWQDAPSEGSTPDYVRLPIFRDAVQWGTVEICFQPMAGGVLGLLRHPVIGTMLFTGLVGFVMYIVYLRRTLKILNPQSVIPERIQAMLNTLTEGVVVLDKQEQIVLANEAFAAYIGMSPDKLQGISLSSLPWETPDSEEEEQIIPWKHATETGETKIGVPLKLTTASMEVRTIMINAAPIHGGDGSTRGALATFDDVTHVEEKNVQLNELVGMLKHSRDQISEQNEELKRLATRDPLTNCFNRRSLFEQFDALWQLAHENGKDLGCVMFDIDKFKSINDNHGHAIGDQVLREIAEVLHKNVDEMDVVARYGGEEFVVLVRFGGIDEAEIVAEKLRVAIQERHCAGLDVTSSFGVSGKLLGAKSSKELLEEADQALYAAKHAGRNCVVRIDNMPEAVEEAAPNPEPRAEPSSVSSSSEPDAEPLFIPYQAVTGLVAALTQRDACTGQHSRRVADLCVLVALEIMSPRECFLLEVSALLHDLGKMGIPDSILLKPGRLTDDEYRVMQLHDEMGVSIVSATFGCPELTHIVETHHAWYASKSKRPDLPSGSDIPVAARILCIADAFDAMVSDRPYHTGCDDQEAFAELRRCAGTQFDPELVERFITVVQPYRVRRQDESSQQDDSAMPSSNLSFQLDQAIVMLTDAVKLPDLTSLLSIAGQLKMAAARRGLSQIVQLATDLEHAAASENDLAELTTLADQLLELCHSSLIDPETESEVQNEADNTRESNEEETPS